MYNDNNENDSQYRYSGSDIPYNNTNNNSTANNNTAFSSAPYDAKKHKRHKGGFAKKAACFVLSAVLFGAIAGSVMFGVNYAGGKIVGSNKSNATGVNISTVSNNISNVAKTNSAITEDTDLSSSSKMDVEAVATAATFEGKAQAEYFRDTVKVAMDELRAPVDKAEMIVDKEFWPFPSYSELLFEV